MLDDGGGPWVGEDIFENVFSLDDGFLLDVSCVWAEVAVRVCVCVESFGFRDHAFV